MLVQADSESDFEVWRQAAGVTVFHTGTSTGVMLPDYDVPQGALEHQRRPKTGLQPHIGMQTGSRTARKQFPDSYSSSDIASEVRRRSDPGADNPLHAA